MLDTLKCLWNEKFAIAIMISFKRTFNITVQYLLQFFHRNLQDMDVGWYADYTTSDITPHNELSKYCISYIVERLDESLTRLI